MRLFITGASGLLGKSVVADALRKGHRVCAMVRPGTDVSSLPWHGHERLEYARIDLRVPKGLAEYLKGVDCVLHLAAKVGGEFYDQYEGTVIATENLLSSMKEAGVNRLVHISSFSVYAALDQWSWSLLDEEAALESKLDERDDYAYTKTIQERMVRSTAREEEWHLTVLRPGLIYGADDCFGPLSGISLGSNWLMMGAFNRVPLTYVENCAQTVVLSAEVPEAAGQTLNVVDPNPPRQWWWCRQVQRRTEPKPRLVPLPWWTLRAAAALLSAFNRLFCKGQLKVPGLFVSARLHARFKPRRYSTDKVQQVLGWIPRYSVEQALDRCYGPGPDYSIEERVKTEGVCS